MFAYLVLYFPPLQMGLSVYLIERLASAWIAGAARGMSPNVKVVRSCSLRPWCCICYLLFQRIRCGRYGIT